MLLTLKLRLVLIEELIFSILTFLPIVLDQVLGGALHLLELTGRTDATYLLLMELLSCEPTK